MSYKLDLPCAAGELRNGAGIQPHSSPEQYVIFAIDLPQYAGAFKSEIAAGFTGTAYEDGRNAIGCKELVGYYKGTLEASYIVNARDWPAIAKSGWINKQESVLHLGAWANGGRPATLYYADGHSEAIGKFQLASRATALKKDGWTFDASLGEYFICQ